MRGRIRGTTAVLGVAAAVALLSGCAGQATQAPPPSSVVAAGTPKATPSGERYDLTVERPFTLSDGSSATGCVQVAVDVAATTDGTADPRVVRARALLTRHDWQSEPVSLDELSADEQKIERDRGESEQVMLAGILMDHISKALTDAGLLGDGLSVRGHVGC
ncbi:hypothetical protein [Leifsonia sp. C5G2]|uniref:hypothetical protein n=1 Tax=Leifsonia sp. C5G2 TaxID=2735269 RepID=UPI001584E1CC|nr:hypothetical protein [Leifsonia sp. C5G2]NUU07303.1 hypothetical protein [Leifsonia sp. C5G2]